MLPDVTANSMTLLVITVVILSMLHASLASLDLQGAKCGDKRCNTSEYCSPYDTHCRPCTEACDVNSRNYQPSECIRDCQVYLQDQRYVLRMDLGQYDDLREVERLKIMFTVTTTLTCFSLLGILYLLGRTLIRWEKIQNTLRAVFSKNWAKQATGKNKVQNDVETAVIKQNGLKLAMPTISATVEQEAKSNTNSNGTTPETTSTSLSRRYPSEDTTLDFAYDNPAMTPSPEAAQLRTKRESSF
ncbi:protein grindelwald isoform X3 [Ooceraea biroi]|uniref:protein grindelwald isoform X3 n=1 Tax=Ooceraea biroi TaxID=2015173 RepID=UPI0005BBA923|nr:protein grindelwald isoform X3 [Ooceraea biroi]